MRTYRCGGGSEVVVRLKSSSEVPGEIILPLSIVATGCMSCRHARMLLLAHVNFRGVGGSGATPMSHIHTTSHMLIL